MMRNMIIYLWLFTIVMGCKNPEPETYLIPEGFKGRVNIIFNQPKGVPAKYENGRRIYQVPIDGILLTQFKDEYGIIDHKYYYIDGRGNKKGLRIFNYEYNKDGTTKWIIKDGHEVGVFFDGTTGAYGNGNIKYQEFRVSDYFSLDSMESKGNFLKRLEEVLHSNFAPDTLSTQKMKEVEQRLKQSNK
jgi:hypothetical protein